MAKLDIDFVLIDESVVDYGFRALMSGAELDEFKANPVMLLLHLRGNEGYDRPKQDVMLPIGKWYDIRVEGSRLLAKPDFDDDDPLAKRVEAKVKKGYLNAASVWIDPITVSDDPDLMLPGQYGPSLSKWGVREGSIVDIPNCRGSLAIRNGAGTVLTLSSKDTTDKGKVLEYLNSLLPAKNNNEMDNKKLAAALGLPETATEEQIFAKLSATNSAPNTQLAAENADLKKKLEDMEKTATETKVNALVDGAIKDLKLAAGDKDAYVKLATADYETTKALIEKMKPYESVANKLAGDATNVAHKAELEGLLKLSGKELWQSGKLERLKDLDKDNFKHKYKEAFNVEYKD